MTTRMQEDQPTELELIEEMYPGFDPDDYADDEHLADAIWDAHSHDTIEMYRRIGRDVYPNPYMETMRVIDHAATVLWESKERVRA